MIPEPSCNSLKKEIWKLQAPRKIKHFLWQALSGYVASASKLKERQCGNDSTCQRCGAEDETINHILFECPPSIQCWALSSVPSAPGYFPFSSIYVNFDILLQVLKDTNRSASVLLIPWLIWYLWKARNDKCFNNIDTSPMDTLKLAGYESEAWMMAQVEPGSGKNQINSDEMEKEGEDQEEHGRWRCQFDASWVADGDGVGLGFTLFDGATVVMSGQKKRSNTSSPLHAETEGLLWAMEELRERGLQQVNFKSDCQQLVQIIRSSKQWPALDPELDAFETLRVAFSYFSLSFISRSLNSRADFLAKEACSRVLNFVRVDVLVPKPLAIEASMAEPF